MKEGGIKFWEDEGVESFLVVIDGVGALEIGYGFWCLSWWFPTSQKKKDFSAAADGSLGSADDVDADTIENPIDPKAGFILGRQSKNAMKKCFRYKAILTDTKTTSHINW